MAVGEQDVASHMARFERACREAGAKLTHQRTEIFREVARTGDHPDAETVYRRVRARIPSVSLDTIYRTLWLLVDLGLIQTLGSARDRTRFDANLDRHHHFVCVECGLTEDFYSTDFDALALPESVKGIGLAEVTQVEVRGVCLGCAAKDARRPRAPSGSGEQDEIAGGEQRGESHGRSD